MFSFHEFFQVSYFIICALHLINKMKRLYYCMQLFCRASVLLTGYLCAIYLMTIIVK